MSSSMWLEDNPRLITITLTMPFLEEPFLDVDEQYVHSLLELGFSLVINRYVDRSKLDQVFPNRLRRQLNIFGVEDFNQLEEYNQMCDEYEEISIQNVLYGIIDHEVETLKVNSDDYENRYDYYTHIVNNIVTKLSNDLIHDPVYKVDVQLSVLESCFKRFDAIIINKYRYDPHNQYLWLAING